MLRNKVAAVLAAETLRLLFWLTFAAAAAGHEEMTIEEIMLGKGDYYPGLVPLVYAYLGYIGCDADTMETVDQVGTTVYSACLLPLFIKYFYRASALRQLDW